MPYFSPLTFISLFFADALQMTQANMDLKRHARILDLLPDLIIGVNRQGEIAYVSASVTRKLRYPPDLLRGASIFDLVTPHTRHVVSAVLQRSSVKPTAAERLADGRRDLTVDGSASAGGASTGRRSGGGGSSSSSGRTRGKSGSRGAAGGEGGPMPAPRAVAVSETSRSAAGAGSSAHGSGGSSGDGRSTSSVGGDVGCQGDAQGGRDAWPSADAAAAAAPPPPEFVPSRAPPAVASSSAPALAASAQAAAGPAFLGSSSKSSSESLDQSAVGHSSMTTSSSTPSSSLASGTSLSGASTGTAGASASSESVTESAPEGASVGGTESAATSAGTPQNSGSDGDPEGLADRDSSSDEPTTSSEEGHQSAATSSSDTSGPHFAKWSHLNLQRHNQEIDQQNDRAVWNLCLVRPDRSTLWCEANSSPGRRAEAEGEDGVEVIFSLRPVREGSPVPAAFAVVTAGWAKAALGQPSSGDKAKPAPPSRHAVVPPDWQPRHKASSSTNSVQRRPPSPGPALEAARPDFPVRQGQAQQLVFQRVRRLARTATAAACSHPCQVNRSALKLRLTHSAIRLSASRSGRGGSPATELSAAETLLGLMGGNC